MEEFLKNNEVLIYALFIMFAILVLYGLYLYVNSRYSKIQDKKSLETQEVVHLETTDKPKEIRMESLDKIVTSETEMNKTLDLSSEFNKEEEQPVVQKKTRKTKTKTK